MTVAPAIFGITNDGVNLAVNLVILSLVVIWLALIYWTYVDAKRRLEDPVLIGCAVAASAFPFIGAVVYSIVRPAEYLEDVHERDLETRAAELRMRELEAQTCPSCEYHVQPSYLRCPECGHGLKHACPSCARPVAPGWRFCPYCETSLTKPPPAKKAPRQRRAAPKAARKKAAPAVPAAPAAPAASAASAASSARAAPAGAKSQDPEATQAMDAPVATEGKDDAQQPVTADEPPVAESAFDPDSEAERERRRAERERRRARS